jgi:hypothetical protein
MNFGGTGVSSGPGPTPGFWGYSITQRVERESDKVLSLCTITARFRHLFAERTQGHEKDWHEKD